MDDWGLSVGILVGDTASARVERCVIDRTGGCGAAVLSDAGSGTAYRSDMAVFRDDLFVLTGGDHGPAMRGHCLVPVMDQPAGVIAERTSFHSSMDGPKPDAQLATSIAPLVKALGSEPALAESEFLRDFGNMATP